MTDVKKDMLVVELLADCVYVHDGSEQTLFRGYAKTIATQDKRTPQREFEANGVKCCMLQLIKLYNLDEAEVDEMASMSVGAESLLGNLYVRRLK